MLNYALIAATLLSAGKLRQVDTVPVYKRGDTRQLIFGQTVKQNGPIIDTTPISKRSKRRNKHK